MPVPRLLAGTLLVLAGCVPAAPAPAPSATVPLIDSLPSATPRPPVSDVVPAGAFLFYEDFEQGTARWAVPPSAGPGWRLLQAFTCGGAYTMHLGLPAQTPFTPAAGESVLALAAPLDLRRGRAPRLKFDVLGTAQPDGAIAVQAEARTPGGSWAPLGEAVTARHATMRSIVRDLTPWAGGAVELRFLATIGPGAAPTKGLYLDDVQVIEPTVP